MRQSPARARHEQQENNRDIWMSRGELEDATAGAMAAMAMKFHHLALESASVRPQPRRLRFMEPRAQTRHSQSKNLRGSNPQPPPRISRKTQT